MNTNLFHDCNTLPSNASKESQLFCFTLLANKTWNIIHYISGSDQSMYYANKKYLFTPIT